MKGEGKGGRGRGRRDKKIRKKKDSYLGTLRIYGHFPTSMSPDSYFIRSRIMNF